VGEILAQEDQDDKDKKAADEPKPVEVTAEDTMSFTEQLELAKKARERWNWKSKKGKGRPKEIISRKKEEGSRAQEETSGGEG